MADDVWATRVPTFVDAHYSSMRGIVRNRVVDAQLRAHLPHPPAHIVDVGGGAGTQSLPLAQDGYHVTIVDPSPAMLERAAWARDAHPDAAASRVRLVRASGVDATDRLDGQRFDAVLCHGVISYQPDPEPLVGALCRLAAPGGLVSLLVKNAAVMALRPAFEGRWRDALRAFDETHEVNSLGLPTWATSLQTLTSWLHQHDVELVDWYGVRLFVETWEPGELASPDDVDDIVAVETEAARRDPYRSLSRLLHLVGRRA